MTRRATARNTGRMYPAGSFRAAFETVHGRPPPGMRKPGAQPALVMPAPKVRVPATAGSVAEHIRCHAYRAGDVAELTAELARQVSTKWAVVRDLETTEGRVELMVDGVAVIVRVGVAVEQAFRSLWRLAQVPDVRGLVLVVARAPESRSRLPSELAGKDIRIVQLKGEE